MNFDKVLTDNPYVDNMLYYVKQLVYGTILKDEETALLYETTDTLKTSNEYLRCIDNRVTFEDMNITANILIEAGVEYSKLESYLEDRYNIPEGSRDNILKVGRQYIIDNYDEQNNYYRKLNGKPNIEDEPILVSKYLEEDIIGFDPNRYLHTLSSLEISLLESYGILDKIKESNSNEYLNFLGDNSIDIYTSRRAYNFQAIFIPDVGDSVIKDRFVERLELNRDYTVKCIYSEAFKYGSDYYDAFIRVLIVIQSMVDMISDLQEFITKKELLDLRTVQFILESYGVPYYSEIPLKYQINMVKNLNTLIKFKSTTRNMIDICSLFGFNNITIFKYYLLKERQLDENGNFIFANKEVEDDEGSITIEQDLDAMYKLKFIKVKLNEDTDEYIRDKANHLQYDEIVEQDDTWNGIYAHDIVKNNILEREFNYVKTKYISIDTVYDLSRLTFEIAYFYNMLYNDDLLEEELYLDVPILSNNKIRLTDVFVFLTSITYIYNGIADDILDTRAKVLNVLGFNFKINMAELSTYIYNQGYTLEDLGVEGFIIPTSTILSYNQLINIFTKNKEIRYHLVNEMYKANDKKIYDIYKTLYDALYITEMNHDYYGDDPETGEKVSSYKRYLQLRNTDLYNKIIECLVISDDDERQTTISEIISNVVYYIDEYMDSDELMYIYNGLPAVSANAIQKYIELLINFFKSYKVSFLGLNTIYKFDDKFDNLVRAIDNIMITESFTKRETINIINSVKNISSLSPKDRVTVIEKMFIDAEWWKQLSVSSTSTVVSMINDIYTVFEKYDLFTLQEYKSLDIFTFKEEDIKIIDKYIDIISVLIKNDTVGINDNINTSTQYDKYTDNDYHDNIMQTISYLKRRDTVNLFDIMSKNTTLKKSDYVNIIDKIKIDSEWWKTLSLEIDNVIIQSIIEIYSVYDKYDKFKIDDDMSISYTMIPYDDISIIERNVKLISYIDKIDINILNDTYKLSSLYNKYDNINIQEFIKTEYYSSMNEEIPINIYLDILASTVKYINYNINDELNINNTIKRIDSLDIDEKLSVYLSSINKKDIVNIFSYIEDIVSSKINIDSINIVDKLWINITDTVAEILLTDYKNITRFGFGNDLNYIITDMIYYFIHILKIDNIDIKDNLNSNIKLDKFDIIQKYGKYTVDINSSKDELYRIYDTIQLKID